MNRVVLSLLAIILIVNAAQGSAICTSWDKYPRRSELPEGWFNCRDDKDCTLFGFRCCGPLNLSINTGQLKSLERLIELKTKGCVEPTCEICQIDVVPACLKGRCTTKPSKF
jgi:hypothetical protein